MENSRDTKKSYSGKLIARNTVYNFIGYGAPLIVAVIFIPLLIKGLGTEKFGLLNIIWILIGYFSFFDFGIGKTLTKIVSEKNGLNKEGEIPGIFWTSIFLMLAISLIGTIVLLLLTKILVYDFLNVSNYLKEETQFTFYVIAISIPVVTTTAGLRGVLEAYQEFGIINIIRIFLGVSTFLAPMVCLLFSNSLLWIVVVLSIVRIIVFILYFIQCLKININIKREFGFDTKLIKPILKQSSWITISNITAPLIIYVDRFIIGALISATAITYYATPYEIVTKILLIPGAIITVLFPAFSATYYNDPFFSKKLFSRGVKYLFLSIFPVVLVIVFFSYEGLNIWLGQSFAEKSGFVLETLVIGVLINSLAYIPFNFLIGIGKPDVVSKLQLLELPFYILFLLLIIHKFGINGVAVIWTLRVLIDAAILFFISQRNMKLKIDPSVPFLICLAIITLSIPFFIGILFVKIIVIVFVLVFFAFYVWNRLLLEDEKNYIKKIHLLFSK